MPSDVPKIPTSSFARSHSLMRIERQALALRRRQEVFRWLAPALREAPYLGQHFTGSTSEAVASVDSLVCQDVTWWRKRR